MQDTPLASSIPASGIPPRCRARAQEQTPHASGPSTAKRSHVGRVWAVRAWLAANMPYLNTLKLPTYIAIMSCMARINPTRTVWTKFGIRILFLVSSLSKRMPPTDIPAFSRPLINEERHFWTEAVLVLQRPRSLASCFPTVFTSPQGFIEAWRWRSSVHVA
jgi:hypothetical protein